MSAGFRYFGLVCNLFRDQEISKSADIELDIKSKLEAFL